MADGSEQIVLFSDKKNCCGCGACMSACPKDAIKMVPDEHGFIYPEISKDICIKCKKCINTCAYQMNSDFNVPQKAYAAVNKDDEQLIRSASGGLFSLLAEYIIENDGTVFGSSLYHNGNKLVVEHIRVNDKKDISKLQGSKYVQSDTSEIFRSVENDLKTGKQVLFTGTPCQVGALKGFLKIDYDNLLTVDIICHGVPSEKLFSDYILLKEKKEEIKITDYKFRYKNKDFSTSRYTSYIEFEDSKKQKHYRVMNGKEESFVFLFLKSQIFRENCYSCKYAGSSRISDITIGDYWGFYSEHKNADDKIFSDFKGISCLIINTLKGNKAVENIKEKIYFLGSSFDSVARHNDQLVSPSKIPDKRKIVLDCYSASGYNGVDEYFKNSFKKELFIEKIKYKLPKSMKRNIKKTISNIKAGLKK